MTDGIAGNILCFLALVGYNQYVDEIGGVIGAGPCQNEGKILHIDGKVKFLHFLSDSDEGEGNDWLYMVISHIVSFLYNPKGEEKISGYLCMCPPQGIFWHVLHVKKAAD